MPEGVLGLLPLREIRGVWSDLLEKLASGEGPAWLAEFKKFLDRKPCWVPAQAVSVSASSSRLWREENGIIRFSVTSDGTTGEAWITRLEGKGFRVGDYAKSVLRSKSFKPTSGITTEVAVLKGDTFSDDDLITAKIRKEAKRRKWSKPHAEVACLIREKFSDEEIAAMGLGWIVTMHEPISDYVGSLSLLGANRYGDGRRLNACKGRPEDKWSRDGGLAFAVSPRLQRLSVAMAGRQV